MPISARVAYLIMSYTLPDQVSRLASVLRRGSPASLIVVHHDDRRSSVDAARLDALGVLRVEPPSTAAWGEATQLAMVLRCLRFTLDARDFDWVVMLSGQDYPIRPVAEIEHSLATTDADALIETRACARPNGREEIDEFAARYHFRWRRIKSRAVSRLAGAAIKSGSLVRLRTMPSGSWIGVRAVRSPFGPGLVCHYGSDWFTLSRPALEAIERFAGARRDVLDYYRRTLIPTESFVQTVLANDASLRLASDYRRYSVWDSPRMRGPRILREHDLDAMLGSGGDFARKFDETVDRAVLDEIDRRVHSS
jgi:Core-2/I-Branching enzyme